MAVEFKWHMIRFILPRRHGPEVKKGKEVRSMAPPQQITKGKKLNRTDTAQKVKPKKKASITAASPKSKKTEEARPISKYKEWKLLYTPYPFRTADNRTSSMKGSAARSNAEEKDSGKYKGLCRSCKKQKTCTLPKPDGGVWRCEDYE